MKRPSEDRGWGVASCLTCGKRCYLDRKSAKRQAKARHPGEHLSEYRCGDYWHIGHTPPALIYGVENGVR
jgi:hypothetical protein